MDINRDCLAEKKVELLEELWKQLDVAWVRNKHSIDIVHDIELSALCLVPGIFSPDILHPEPPLLTSAFPEPSLRAQLVSSIDDDFQADSNR